MERKNKFRKKLLWMISRKDLHKRCFLNNQYETLSVTFRVLTIVSFSSLCLNSHVPVYIWIGKEHFNLLQQKKAKYWIRSFPCQTR